MRSPLFWLIRREGKTFVAAVVIIGLVAFAWVKFPMLQRNAGFGPDWDCSAVGKGDPVCVRKPPVPSIDQSSQK